MKEVFIVMIIHERIRQLRQEQHLRQAAFAERIAYSTHSVMEWEKGTNPPGAIALFNIANAFNVSLDWLFGRTDER